MIVKKALIFVLKKPLLSLFGLILSIGVLTGLSSFLGSGENVSDIPIVQAESRPFKIVPSENNGQLESTGETTVFNALREPNNFSVVASADKDRKGRVENLLRGDEAANRQAAEKLAAFSESVDRIIEKQGERSLSGDLNEPISNPVVRKIEKEDVGQTIAVASASDFAAVEKPSTSTQEATIALNAVKPAAIKPTAKPEQGTIKQMNAAAGTTPETLAFVRSILEEDSRRELTPDQAAQALALVKPAAGAASSAAQKVGETGYFVQLASVTSEPAAHQEWNSKHKNSYGGIMAQASYRVQEANLGERGTFYRIQAGPFSKEQAGDLCAQIKVQNPNGCLVVK